MVIVTCQSRFEEEDTTDVEDEDEAVAVNGGKRMGVHQDPKNDDEPSFRMLKEPKELHQTGNGMIWLLNSQ